MLPLLYLILTQAKSLSFGDLSYSYRRSHLSTQISLRWASRLEDCFYNVMHSGENNTIPNLRSNNEFYSTVDYIFIGNQIHPMFRFTDVYWLHSSWTNSQLFSLSINLIRTSTGLKPWRTQSHSGSTERVLFSIKVAIYAYSISFA